MSDLLRHRRLVLPAGLAAILVALLVLLPREAQQEPVDEVLEAEVEPGAGAALPAHSGRRSPAEPGTVPHAPPPARHGAGRADPERSEAEARQATESRERLVGRNIASLEKAAAVAEAEGNPQRAALMRRRAELLAARLDET